MRRVQVKRAVAFSAVLSAAFMAVPAAAQVPGFGEGGQLVISGDRLAGVFWIDASIDADGTADVPGPADAATVTDVETDGTQIAFLGNDRAVGPSSVPRLGLDFFVIPNLSLGGSFIYVSDSDNSDTSNRATVAGTTFDTRDETETRRSALVFAPRVGYGAQFTDVIGLWARGGITYFNQNEEVDVVTTQADGDVVRADTETNLSLLQLSLEAMLLLIPIEHFGIGVGPFIDIPITGSFEIDTNDDGALSNAEGDLSAFTFGLSANLLGWF
jgi:hypothetical protein